jgi:tetratricopeptide (TPR) repeat protein
MIEAKQGDRAATFLERAKQLFPQYAGPDNPYEHLATLHLERGDRRAAAAELTALTRLNENHYAANVKLAELLTELGDQGGAVEALERAVYIHPYDVAVHERLATLYAARGQFAGAVRERRAILALDPVDRSGALYQLALAQRDAGDKAAARRTVLQALEMAPGFEQAQTLLLSLQGEGRE